eukprot:TRINITY_DN22635_c0_g1_i2.p1 TRINITY_DN22635_c0_g1~~TRINITY_DN22635_c0_g1_i2.p1  ORF type:complete len:666 (+),score=182.24 TRINITY_DN22635_c0_g1_i2:85-1998(+)
MWESGAEAPTWGYEADTGMPAADHYYPGGGYQQNSAREWVEDYKWQLQASNSLEGSHEQSMLQQQFLLQQQMLQQHQLKNLQHHQVLQTLQQQQLAMHTQHEDGQSPLATGDDSDKGVLRLSLSDALAEKSMKPAPGLPVPSLAPSVLDQLIERPPGAAVPVPPPPPPPPEVGPSSEQFQYTGYTEMPSSRPKQKQANLGHQEEAPTKGVRAGTQLRQLLDFYFEPFNLQHNKYLIDLLSRKLGSPAKAGPWSADQLFSFSFRLEDLLGLNRIAAALDKLRSVGCEACPGPDASGSIRGSSELIIRRRAGNRQLKPAVAGVLKHLVWSEKGDLMLRSPPEVRSFVPATIALADDVLAAAAQISAVWEKQTKAPVGMLSISSINCNCEAENRLSEQQAQSFQGQLKRQLLLFRVDIICLQGLNPLSGNVGTVIAIALAEDGYEHVWSAGDEEVSVIFWHKSRFSLVRHVELDGAVAADLCAVEDPTVTIRIANLKAKVPKTTDTGLDRLLGEQANAKIVSVDCSELGGADVACIVEELTDLNSLARDVLGEEIEVPLCARDPTTGSIAAARASASGLNKLTSPDALLYKGLTPLLALSGHSSSYLAALSPEDVASQFPAFRMPILGCFDWRKAATQCQ